MMEMALVGNEGESDILSRNGHVKEWRMRMRELRYPFLSGSEVRTSLAIHDTRGRVPVQRIRRLVLAVGPVARE